MLVKMNMTRSYCITFFFIEIQTYLSQSCGNFLFKSHQDELWRSREGYSRNSDYGGVIRDGWCCHVELNGSPLGIRNATFSKAETLLHGRGFVQTIDSFQVIISNKKGFSSLNMIRCANGNNQEPWRLCFILRKHLSIYIELKFIMWRGKRLI